MQIRSSNSFRTKNDFLIARILRDNNFRAMFIDFSIDVWNVVENSEEM